MTSLCRRRMISVERTASPSLHHRKSRDLELANKINNNISKSNNNNNSRAEISLAEDPDGMPTPDMAGRSMQERARAERIRLNVGGTCHVTSRETLLRHPGTLLASLDKRSKYYDEAAGEFFFDRDPNLFGCVLNYYRTGDLHPAAHVCGNALRHELRFWGIEESSVSDCCWRIMNQTEDDAAVLKTLKKHIYKEQDAMEESVEKPEPKAWKQKLWNFLENPDSSRAAKVWNSFVLGLIFLSALVYTLDSVEQTRVPVDLSPDKQDENDNISNPKMRKYLETNQHVAIYAIDILCQCIFSLELILRWLVCPSKLGFVKSISNGIDNLTVLTGWVVVGLEHVFISRHELLTQNGLMTYIMLRNLYIFRILRFLRLADRHRGLKVMFLAVWSSLRDLLLLIFIFFLLATICGSFQYYCEFENSHSFESIPSSIWWAIITMTTVGYGDYTPSGLCGRAVGTVCALYGMLVLAMPIAVVATNFNTYYERNKHLERMTRAREREHVAAITPSARTSAPNGLPPSRSSDFVQRRPEELMVTELQ